ncbi:MAG: hypothetical protein BGO50_12230 [Rhodanobacter sp. 67-28]|nr:MAG: hypothetical protein BGO50_12230 [Rhodanobacter sp. 67-28]
MSIAEFTEKGPQSRHPAYDGCVLIPASPEYTVGDVLIGSVYRALLLDTPDSKIDLNKLADLPSKLGDEVAWRHILQRALKAPARFKGEKWEDIIPLVPRLAAHGAVLGAQRNRWMPGRLAAAALCAGVDSQRSRDYLEGLASSLQVTGDDEIAARVIQESLEKGDGLDIASPASILVPPAALWRGVKSEPLTPGERLVADIDALISVKAILPRHQWNVLVQAVLRVGVASYQLWLCMLHDALWARLCAVVDEGTDPPTGEEIEQRWCAEHAGNRPLLELGEDATEAVKAHIARYAVARAGINLTLHALDDAAATWQGQLGVPGDGTDTPCEALAAFVAHVSGHREALLVALRAAGHGSGLRRAGHAIADSDSRYISSDAGTTKNLREFLRFVLGQASRKRGDFEAFDQAYLTRPVNRSTNAHQVVRPGSTMLVALAVCTARAGGDLPASMQDLAAHLRDYGIYAPLGTLTDGTIGRELEQLGLAVETPDAGGGRLLINPFSPPASSDNP